MSDDELVANIFPLLELPDLLCWRQVCRHTLGLLGQAYWRTRLCIPAISEGSTKQKQLLDHYDFPTHSGHSGETRRLKGKINPGPLGYLLNILKKQPSLKWYAEKKRIMVLHRAKDRLRIHRIAAVLGLYTRTVYTQNIHLWSNKSGEYDDYDSGGESIDLDIRAVPEVGVLIYWNPHEIPLYDFAPPKAERPLLVEKKSVTKNSRYPSYNIFRHNALLDRPQTKYTDAIYDEAEKRWREIKGRQDQEWLSLFIEAYISCPPMVRI
jgi:hypothetical protein